MEAVPKVPLPGHGVLTLVVKLYCVIIRFIQKERIVAKTVVAGLLHGKPGDRLLDRNGNSVDGGFVVIFHDGSVDSGILYDRSYRVASSFVQ